MSEPASHGWHLDKRVNVGHILTTVLLAAGFFAWASMLESRIAISETEIAALKEHSIRSEQRIIERMDRANARIEGRMGRIEAKLDRHFRS